MGAQQQDFGHPGSRAWPSQHGRDADSHGDAAFDVFSSGSGRTKSLDGRPHLFGNLCGSPGAGRGENDRDVFGAVVRGYIRYPHSSNHRSGSFRQTMIPFRMQTPVVKFLEVIEVDQQQRDVGSFSQGSVPLPFQRFIKGTLRGQAGAWIGKLEYGQLFLQSPALADVTHDDYDFRSGAGGIT